jgi:hypothetical protein
VTEENYKTCQYIRPHGRDFKPRRHENKVVLLRMSFPMHLCSDLSPAMRVAGQILTSHVNLEKLSLVPDHWIVFLYKSEL